MNKIEYRKYIIGQTDRVVIKVGTRLLTDKSRIPKLIEQIHKLRQKKYQVILVTSGAVGLGMSTMGLVKRPKQLSKKQALASIGQGKLMSLYESAAKKYGFHVSQLLLNKSGLQNRVQHINTLNCINSLLEMNVLPIINENDSVAVDELTFGDNDTLAVLVSMMVRCKTTIILTTVDGLYSIKDGEFGDRISLVHEITPKIKALAQGTDDKENSVGGMKSKLKAADIALRAGECLWIANGKDFSILEKVFMGEDVGTLFVPDSSKKMPLKKRWLSFFTLSFGKIYIDNGALDAILKNGKSLLPSGITSIEGSFKKGDTVDIADEKGNIVARGLINYSAQESKKIMGARTNELSVILSYRGNDEVIHRDNLAVL